MRETRRSHCNSEFMFGFDWSSDLYFLVEQGDYGMVVGSDDGMIPTGQWVQVAATWDGTVGTAVAVHLFINAQEVSKPYSYDGSGTLGYSLATSEPFRIGNKTFQGSLDGKI